MAASKQATGSQPSALKYRSAGRPECAAATQPSGVRTLIPRPLSSQTSSSGIGRP